MSDPRRSCMPETASVSRDGIGEPLQAAETTKSPVGVAAHAAPLAAATWIIDAVAAVPA